MIHAAIAGLGRWGRNLVEASLGHERLKIVRAVEPDIEAAQSFCGQHRLELTDRLETRSPITPSTRCCWRRRIRCIPRR